MSDSHEHIDGGAVAATEGHYKVRWYRSTFYNMTILGLCNFAAPGIWGAMNSLGGGGAESPYLVNTANALTFGLMVGTAWLSSVIVHLVGIKGALVFGTLGYAPFAAGLYTHNRFGIDWLVIVGAALCGISAGVFWMAEAAIAIAYPEPWNKGKALGYWLTYRLAGHILGGAINLGLNADNHRAGKVSYTVFLVFIALQASGPLFAMLLNQPHQVERRDGRKVQLAVPHRPWAEVARITKMFFHARFLLLVLFIGQAVFAEAVYFTYISLWFSVRARALGSFLSGLVAVVGGNLLGAWLDRGSISPKLRVRSAFWIIVVLQGGWWTWAAVLVTKFRQTRPTYDWSSPGFAGAFLVFVALSLGFQLNYLFLYFVILNISRDNDDVIRYSALLKLTESAWQAVSYGVTSVAVLAEVGGVYANFALWAVSIGPAWLIIRHLGVEHHEAGDGEGSKS